MSRPILLRWRRERRRRALRVAAFVSLPILGAAGGAILFAQMAQSRGERRAAELLLRISVPEIGDPEARRAALALVDTFDHELDEAAAAARKLPPRERALVERCLGRRRIDRRTLLSFSDLSETPAEKTLGIISDWTFPRACSSAGRWYKTPSNDSAASWQTRAADEAGYGVISRGILLHGLGRHDLAETHLRLAASLTVSAALRSRAKLALALHSRANDDPAQATKLTTQALALAEGSEDAEALARARHAALADAMRRGEHPGPTQIAQTALAVFRAPSFSELRASFLIVLAKISAQEGDPRRAAKIYVLALDLARRARGPDSSSVRAISTAIEELDLLAAPMGPSRGSL